MTPAIPGVVNERARASARSARQTLREPALKSLLIEVNLNLADHQALVRDLNEMGFEHDPVQVQRAMRKEGQFKGVAEHIFKRAT